MEKDINQTLKKAITAHKEGKLQEAEQLYQESLKIDPKNIDANHNFGVLKVSMNQSAAAIPFFKTAIEVNPNIVQFWISYTGALINEKKFEEAELSCRKIIELKPDYAEAYNNLGIILLNFKKFKEAEVHFKKIIKLKPEFSEAYYNLGITMYKIGKFREAEPNYRKAIEIKPDYVEAHNNLGQTLYKLNRLDEAEASYKKAIEFEPNFIIANYNLAILQKQKILLSKIEHEIKVKNKNSTINLHSEIRLNPNPFIIERKVDVDLVNNLHKINTTKLDETITEVGYLRYGNGKRSDYNLFENDSILIKNVAKDLTKIMEDAVKSKIYIMESFFNIFGEESGITKHCHLSSFDKENKLINQKFSLTYYIDIGDQNSTQPGILKLYNPDKEILPTKGQIVIIPANQMHSAVYNGKSDRVMIGVNFYSLN